MPEPLPDRVARASDRSAASAGRAAWPSPRRSHLSRPLRRLTAFPPTSNAAAGHKSRSPIQLSSTTAGSTAGSAERHHRAPQHKAAFAGCVRLLVEIVILIGSENTYGGGYLKVMHSTELDRFATFMRARTRRYGRPVPAQGPEKHDVAYPRSEMQPRVGSSARSASAVCGLMLRFARPARRCVE